MTITKKKLIIPVLILATLGILFFVNPSLAEEEDCSECGVVHCGTTTCQTSCTYCQSKPEKTVFENLITATSTKQIVDKIADFIAYIGFPAAVIALIYAGIRLLLAQGNEQKVQAAKRTLIWTIVGVTIIISTYAIINTIFKFWETKGFQ